MLVPTTSESLAGLRVLDLSRLLPGPYLTRILADLGADIVKVEAPEAAISCATCRPSSANTAPVLRRSTTASAPSPWTSARRSVAIFRAMALQADIVVESFRPGVLDRLGLGYATLAARNPRLIVCSISGYGQSGALCAAPGHDLGYAARAGVLALFGPADRAPQVPGAQLADIAGGALTSAIGILAAVIERGRTGRGQHLDVSMTRGAAAFLAMELARRCAGTPEPRGEGLLSGGVPCYRVYRTRDGRYMALGALEPKFFADFCARAGAPTSVTKAWRGARRARRSSASSRPCSRAATRPNGCRCSKAARAAASPC